MGPIRFVGLPRQRRRLAGSPSAHRGRRDRVGIRDPSGLTGTDPQVADPSTCVPASTLSAVYYVVKVAIDPDIPNNAGCYRAVQVHMPEGSIVNARPPAAVNARAVVVRRVVDCSSARSTRRSRSGCRPHRAGIRWLCPSGASIPATGIRMSTAEIGTGGMGAAPPRTALIRSRPIRPMRRTFPAEAIELEFPIRIGFWKLRADSGGVGRLPRGGVGFEKRFEVLRGATRISHRGERHLTAPWGLFGGGAGAQSTFTAPARRWIRGADPVESSNSCCIQATRLMCGQAAAAVTGIRSSAIRSSSEVTYWTGRSALRPRLTRTASC